ncbi:Glutamate--tRNA ligase [Brevundimonas vancanneytii]|uniref:Glutamate--tRNA ligase n=1 Tax=Brevundimonas vancanneytii TaxID=1325724 RepID=A0A4P1JXQ2_9CAUL|nr:Glutamate--tRNA ligase [Brevundimonas vancanneytii]
MLRIEDIDPTRCRPEFEAGIYEDLAWLVLDWETPVRRQSDHLADYAAVVEALDRRGLLYRCFRTRKEILDAIGDAPHGPAEAARPGPHPAEEEARLLAEGRPFAWRLSLERAKEALGGAVWTHSASSRKAQAPMARPAGSRRGPKRRATWCWRARTPGPPTIWP